MTGVRRGRTNRVVIALLLLFALATFWFAGNGSKDSLPAAVRPGPRPSLELPCRDLPGAKDTLVIMRTGATEIADKLPIHFSTTLRCYPNYIIFADYDETFHGEHIIDVLESVNSTVKEEHHDFELYRRLREMGRAALNTQELSGPASRPSGNTGKAENPGWKLDKWKFLPMMNRTLSEYPDMKWYVFVETDTYIFWATMLKYLAALDHTQPYYMGGQIWIGEIEFAHGGTGFAVSRPALERVVNHYAAHQKEYENFTDGHWAGDCVLGKAFKDADAPLTYAWPIWQADNPGVVPYARSDNGHRLWCHPTVSYHHLTRDTVEDMWKFEQQWLAKAGQDEPGYLRHKDVFSQYIMPRMMVPKNDWDNESDVEHGPAESLLACRSKCEGTPNCLQYRLTKDGICMSSSDPKMGEARLGYQSGWMMDRIRKFEDSMAPCKDEGWIT